MDSEEEKGTAGGVSSMPQVRLERGEKEEINKLTQGGGMGRRISPNGLVKSSEYIRGEGHGLSVQSMQSSNLCPCVN